jgi:predicted ester cyclase
MTIQALIMGLVALPLSLALAPEHAFAQPATPPGCDQPVDNGALLDRYVTAFNAHDVAAFADVIAEDYAQHNGRAGPGLAGLQTTLRQYFDTFSDFRMEVEDRILAGDKVVARVILTATHSRPVQLGPNAPIFLPTGKKLTWGDIDIWRVAGCKFIEHWDQPDFIGLARQMSGE